MDPKIADELFAEMVDKPVAATDSIPQLLNTQRPNIIFIILESFSTHLMETFGGQPNVCLLYTSYFQWLAAVPRSETRSLYHIEYISDDDVSRDYMIFRIGRKYRTDA